MKTRSILSIDPYEITLGKPQLCTLTKVEIPVNLFRISTIKKIRKNINEKI
jgi:hypothetical protein